MTAQRLALAFLMVGAAACVPRVALDNSRCPCPTGFTCCTATNRCVQSGVTFCEGGGAGGAAGGPGGTGGGNDGTGGGMGGAAGGGDVDAGMDAPPVVVSPFVSVGIGAAHACAVRQDGTIKCVGSNDKGQATPPPGTFYIKSSPGADHTCGQKQDLTDNTKDRAWVCWGDNTYGQATVPTVP